MNNGESLMSAVQWSGHRNAARRKGTSLDSLLLVLGLVVLAAAVVLAATPGETPVTVESGGLADPAQLAAGALSGNEAAFGARPGFERSIDGPANGALSSAEAEWFACNENGFPVPLHSAETFGATPKD